MHRNYRVAALVLAVGISMHQLSAATPCAQYDKEIDGITGIMEIRTFFGPPNYGEDPLTDAREVQGVLFLDRPICTRDSQKTQEQAEQDQIELTLVPDTKFRVDFATYAGKRVSVKGKLFHGFTGHHRTALLLSLSGLPQLTLNQSLNPLRK